MGLHWESLAILLDVSWIPNPIREAFLLNSDLEEATVVAAGTNGFDEAGSFSAWWWTAVIPPIFFRVSESDRNSTVRSLYVDDISCNFLGPLSHLAAPFYHRNTFTLHYKPIINPKPTSLLSPSDPKERININRQIQFPQKP